MMTRTAKIILLLGAASFLTSQVIFDTRYDSVSFADKRIIYLLTVLVTIKAVEIADAIYRQKD